MSFTSLQGELRLNSSFIWNILNYIIFGNWSKFGGTNSKTAPALQNTKNNIKQQRKHNK